MLTGSGITEVSDDPDVSTTRSHFLPRTKKVLPKTCQIPMKLLLAPWPSNLKGGPQLGMTHG